MSVEDVAREVVRRLRFSELSQKDFAGYLNRGSSMAIRLKKEIRLVEGTLYEFRDALRGAVDE